METMKRLVVAKGWGQGGGGMKKQFQRLSVGVKLLLVDMAMMDTFVTPVDVRPQG